MGEGSVVTWPDAVTDPPGMSASWPLSTSLPLGALPGATPCARLHARAVLAEWGLRELAEAAELIVSELVTNAVRASTTPDGHPRYDGAGMPVVVLRMASDRVNLLTEVGDVIPASPAAAGPGMTSHTSISSLTRSLAIRSTTTGIPAPSYRGWPSGVVEARTALVTSSLTMSSAASASSRRPHSASTARACSRAHGVAPGRAPSGRDVDNGHESDIPAGSVTGSAQVTTLPSPIVRGAPLSPSSVPAHCLAG